MLIPKIYSRVNTLGSAAQAEASHLLPRSSSDCVVPCLYLQLLCEEDTQNMLKIWAMGGPPSQLNKEK